MSNPKEKQARFLALYNPVHVPLLRYCEALCRHSETAKELVSEVVLEAFENLDKLRSEAAFAGFLFGIAKNKMRRKYRIYGREISLDSCTEDPSDIAAGPEIKAEVSLLYDALENLPEKQREALILFEVSGLSLKEINDIQGGSLSGVKLRLKRGRTKLKQLLGVAEPAQKLS